MIQEAIYTKLQSVAGLTALIGVRAYLGLMPQNPTYPAITYFQVSSAREAAMGTDPGIVHARFQFDVYDQTADGVRDVCEQLRLALERWRGTSLSSVAQVFDTFIDNIQGPLAELVDAKPVYRGIVEALVHHTE